MRIWMAAVLMTGVSMSGVSIVQSTREKAHMPLLLGLRTAQYHVRTSDLSAARHWYVKALGIQPYFDQPYYVGFNVAGFELGLVPEDRVPPSREGAVAVYWGVANIQEGLDQLLAIGATKTADIQDVGGGIKKVIVLDPFGNPFGLMENPSFGK
jgi:predicted enzyme related to lactoylglutathione lyase